MSDSDDHALSAELIDEITEAVVKPADPRDRAEVIVDLVNEVDQAVKWRHQLHPDGQEERSLAPLVEAAADHRGRMEGLGEDPDSEDEPKAAPTAPRRVAKPRGGSTAI